MRLYSIIVVILVALSGSPVLGQNSDIGQRIEDYNNLFGTRLRYHSHRIANVMHTVPDYGTILPALSDDYAEKLQVMADSIVWLYAFLKDDAKPVPERISKTRHVYEAWRPLTFLSEGTDISITSLFELDLRDNDGSRLLAYADEKGNIVKVGGQVVHPLFFEEPYNGIVKNILLFNTILSSFRTDLVEINNTYAENYKADKEQQRTEAEQQLEKKRQAALKYDASAMAGRAMMSLSKLGYTSGQAANVSNNGLVQFHSASGSFSGVASNLKSTEHNLSIARRMLETANRADLTDPKRREIIRKNISTIMEGFNIDLGNYQTALGNTKAKDVCAVSFDATGMGRVTAYFEHESAQPEAVIWRDFNGNDRITYPSAEHIAKVFRELQQLASKLRELKSKVDAYD